MEKRDISVTKAALLEAAERLMEKCSDPSEVTSRAITKEAGVNLAMINYCYGSREALLFKVFEDLQKKALDSTGVFREILSGSLTPKEKLIRLHFESVRIMLRNYKYSKSIIQYVLLNREIAADRGSLGFIKAHFGEKKTDSECRLIAYEISALHELMMLRYEDIKNSCGIDLSDDSVLESTVRDNIERFLAM